MNSFLARIRSIAGLLMVCASLVYVYRRASSLQFWELGLAQSEAVLTLVAVGGLLYGCTCMLLGCAWHALLPYSNRVHAPITTAVAIYGRSQIHKYLPGNVFHYVGRQNYAKKLGLSHKELAYTAIEEIAVTIAAAAAVSMLVLSHHVDIAVAWLHTVVSEKNFEYLPGFGLAIVIILCLWLAARPAKYKTLTAAKRYFRSFGLFSAFFFVSGIGFNLLVAALSTAGELQLSWPLATQIIGIVALSWLAGFLVPGASAGIGVREAALISLLGAMIDEKVALAAALMYRGVTVLGDLVYFAFSSLITIPNHDSQG